MALISRIFYAYMTIVGLAAGALLVVAPQTQKFVVPPFFWVLIAVALFELGTLVRRRAGPDAALNLNARMIGLVIGALVMLAVTMIAGVEVHFL